MRFVSLGSGSRGNATLVESRGTRLLLDCGLAVRDLEQRLALAEVDPLTLDAVLVTHEHGDHLRGVVALARRYRVRVLMTPGTLRRVPEAARSVMDVETLNPHGGPIPLGDFRIQPFPVPHDAREPCQFVFRAQGRCFGMLTDAGCITPHIVESLADCDGLILECNHDPGMLADGPYPPALQARVGGGLGHLSNAQAASLLARLDPARLQRVAAAHLSEKNNHPALARRALLEAAPDLEDRLCVLEQDRVSPWFEL